MYALCFDLPTTENWHGPGARGMKRNVENLMVLMYTQFRSFPSSPSGRSIQAAHPQTVSQDKYAPHHTRTAHG